MWGGGRGVRGWRAWCYAERGPACTVPGCDDGEIACAACGGWGEKDCTCLDCGNEHKQGCSQCRGAGWTKCAGTHPPPSRPGIIAGQSVDMALFQRWTEHLPTGEVEVWAGGPMDTLKFSSPTWTLYVNPMMPSEMDGLPVLEIDTPVEK